MMAQVLKQLCFVTKGTESDGMNCTALLFCCRIGERGGERERERQRERKRERERIIKPFNERIDNDPSKY